MKYLKIQNDGQLDIRLVALIGGTTKDEDQYKIGKFGTGLKYVLAFLFRNNIDFKIFIDDKLVNVSIEKETIAKQIFEIICINNQRTSITTKMGMDWKAWMIVREIYSNALDEGGAVYELTEDVKPEKGKTVFYIELVPEIMKVYNNWNKYFIVGNEPMFENDDFAIHPSGETLKLYKHGILIYEDKNVKSVFNYDIKNAKINELREYKDTVSYDLYRCICNLDNKSIEYFLENCTEDHYEGKMDYSWDFLGDGRFSEEWSKTIGNAELIHKKAIDDIVARGLEIDLSAVIMVPVVLYRALTKKFKGIGALRVADKIGDFFEIYNAHLESKIKECLEILEQAGYFIDPELKFIHGIFGDKKVLAKVDLDKKEILISEKHLEKSLFDTCAMLVEENEHYKTGHEDCSRAFQQHFIDLFTQKMLDKEGIKL